MKDLIDRIQELLLIVSSLQDRIRVLEDKIHEMDGNDRKRSL
jgi:hypothetical protein